MLWDGLLPRTPFELVLANEFLQLRELLPRGLPQRQGALDELVDEGLVYLGVADRVGDHVGAHGHEALGVLQVEEMGGDGDPALLAHLQGVDPPPLAPPAPPIPGPCGEVEAWLRQRGPLPFDEVLLDILATTRLVKSFQLVNGLKPEMIEAAVRGEHVGTIVHAG